MKDRPIEKPPEPTAQPPELVPAKQKSDPSLDERQRARSLPEPFKPVEVAPENDPDEPTDGSVRKKKSSAAKKETPVEKPDREDEPEESEQEEAPIPYGF